jgi:DNA-binding CsgD family transcriptional regulator
MAKVSDLALSQRQLDCLLKAAEHKDSAVIAYELGISKHTVDNHIAAAVRKLGVASRRQAVQLVLAHERGEPTSDPIISDFSLVDVNDPGGPSPALPEALADERRDRGEPNDVSHRSLAGSFNDPPRWQRLVPLRPRDGADNQFSAGQTLVLIVLAAIFLLVGAGALLNGLVGLRDLR